MAGWYYFRALVPHDRPVVEIGPSFSPIVSKRLGFDVRVVDHADRAALIEKYRDQVPDVSAIEEVDVIWTGEPLSSLLPSSFALLIEELRYIGLIDLTIRLICWTRECEFAAILSRSTTCENADAAEFAQLKVSLHLNMLREEAEGIAFMQPLLAATAQA